MELAHFIYRHMTVMVETSRQLAPHSRICSGTYPIHTYPSAILSISLRESFHTKIQLRTGGLNLICIWHISA